MLKPQYRAWFFLLLISFAIIYLGHSFAGRQGVLWAVAIALGINSMFFFFGEWRVAPLLDGQILEGQDPWGLNQRVAKWSEQLRLPLPSIHILAIPTPQALAVGSLQRSGRIYLSQNLVETFSTTELDGIIACLLVSLRRAHTLSFAVTGALADGLLLLAQLIDRTLRIVIGTKRSPEAVQNNLVTYLVSPLLALVMRLGISRSDYFEIDQAAAQLTGQPKELAEALWKLESWARTNPYKVPAFLAHFYLVSPLTSKGWSRYFLVQPRAELRIQRLLGHFPI